VVEREKNSLMEKMNDTLNRRTGKRRTVRSSGKSGKWMGEARPLDQRRRFAGGYQVGWGHAPIPRDTRGRKSHQREDCGCGRRVNGERRLCRGDGTVPPSSRTSRLFHEKTQCRRDLYNIMASRGYEGLHLLVRSHRQISRDHRAKIERRTIMGRE